MKITLDAQTVTGLIDGEPPYLRQRMDQAEARGATFHMSSLVLHDVALAAMTSEQAARKLAQLDAFLARVEVVAWTSEDALTAARLRADREKQVSGQSLWIDDAAQILHLAQALNNDWTVVTFTRTQAVVAPMPGLLTIDWSAPGDD
ncbi:MAG TPA: PIN domain-containing protein [Caulobacteraceae bacterium]|nr:PIN domain-containing protein [Caulobacteraceae bacterium]